MTEFRFLSSLPASVGLLLVVAAALISWWLYRREIYDFPRPYRWLLPTLRSTAIALTLMMLLEPTLRSRYFEGTPTRLQVWLDGTASMAEEDTSAKESGSRPNRYARALEMLATGDTPKLEKWADQGEVFLGRFGADRSAQLWQSTVKQPAEVPQDYASLQPSEWFQPTSLSQLLIREKGRVSGFSAPANEEEAALSVQETERASPSENLQSNPILLFTDGQHNSGKSPLEVVAGWPKESAPLYIVGMGRNAPPETATLLAVDSPTQLFRTDRLQGTLQIQDGLPAGEPFQVAIYHEGELLWSEPLRGEGSGGRNIPFSFSIEEVVKKLEQNQPTDQSVQRLTIPLTARIELPSTDGAVVSKSERSWLLGVTTRKQRILLLDSRSRWESRYLRNALERDPQWSVDAYLVSPGKAPRWFAQSGNEVPFPLEGDDYLNYDLIITGELEPGALSAEQQDHLQHAVVRGGAGWIVIDGARGYWEDPSYKVVRSLIPTEKISVDPSSSLQSWRAVPVIDSPLANVLELGDGTAGNNETIWNQLPELKMLVPVKELPGSQILATAERGKEAYPLIVTRNYGAGRIVYFASDETWRWRYEVADKIHQRFWNQMSRWAMRLPFAVESEYLALDSGQPMYRIGEAIEIRARVRNSDGEPSQLSTIEAVASKSGQIMATTTLALETSLPGVYRGRFVGLQAGDYDISLQVPGLSLDANPLKTEIRVLEPENPELLRVARNDDLLTQLATATGGMYVTEDKIEQLWDHMELRHNSKLIESDQLLWQSFWWFIPILALIAMEWWLRKKAGLI